MCSTYQWKNLAHATTSRSDPCASYRALWREGLSRSDCMEDGGRGGECVCGFQNNRPSPSPPPSFLYPKYAWTAERRAQQRMPIKNAEIRLLVLTSLWKIISSIFRDLFTWRDLKAQFGRKQYDRLIPSSLGPCCIIFSSRSDVRFCENRNHFFFFFPKKRCTETWKSSTCKWNNFNYYLYMYMYCI